LEPIVVPRHLPNPFPLGDFLKDVRRLILRLVRSEYETEAKAARVLDQPLSRFPLRKASEPSGLRRRLLESDARPDFSRVLLYSPTAVDEALLRALREAGFHPFWEPKPYLVTKRIHDERIGLAVLQADESREIIAAKAIVRLRPDMPVFLTGMGTLVTSIVATGFGLRDRLFGEVAPDALATLLDATRQRIALTEIREREYDLAGRPSFDDPTPSDEDGSTPERSFELDVDRVLRAIERAVIVIGLDEYGSERRAYEPLGFRSLSSLQRRMSALGIPPRPRSRTPPNVPQVP
jgi:hypothetical protein